MAPFARIRSFILAFWWGGLTFLGGLVVPLLFARLPNKALAGNMAAQLFEAQTWVALVCGCLLLMGLRGRASEAVRSADVLWIVLAMLVAALNQFAVAPRILAREDLALWHGVGTALLALQWLSLSVLMWKKDLAHE